MDYKRVIPYALTVLFAMLLWNTWMKEHVQEHTATPSDVHIIGATHTDADLQSLAPGVKPSSSATVNRQDSEEITPTSRTVTVKTDVLDIKIDKLGGRIISLKLPAFPASKEVSSESVALLNQDTENYYQAYSGLTNTPNDGKLTYRVSSNRYELPANKEQQQVVLSWQGDDGLRVVKTFTFTRGSYVVDVDYQVNNGSGKVWQGSVFSQIKRVPEEPHGMFGMRTFTGAAISSPEKPYKKISYAKLKKENVAENIMGGWIAMQQHYFLSAWIPNNKQTFHYFSRVASNIYTVGMVGPVMSVNPGASKRFGMKLYSGPEKAAVLETVAPNLKLTIDYGWLWPVSVLLFWLMQKLYALLGNWGFAIIGVTIAIKLVFYKLSEKSFRSMARMRDLQPKMQAIKDRYADDKQKLSKATMELYRKEKVNPVGGCLPILIQIPVFIALYYVLIESVELRQAPFILWITDLAVKDPYYVLPILMGLSMFAQQKLNPASPDPMMAKVTMFMPIIFTVFFLSFPAGLVLYWLVNNCLSVAQQWYIMRKYSGNNKTRKKK